MPTYEGWTNYPTWCVNLWISNEQGSMEYWRERATAALGAINPRHYREVPPAARHELANELQEAYEENNPVTTEQHGLYSDLMMHALKLVNWSEVAESLLQDVIEYAQYTEADRE